MGYATSLVEKFGWSCGITRRPLPVLRSCLPHRGLSPRTVMEHAPEFVLCL